MAEKASVKLKHGEKTLKAKGPVSFVRSVVSQLKDTGMKVASPEKFRYRASGESQSTQGVQN